MPADRLRVLWQTCATCLHNNVAHQGTLDGSCGHLTWRPAERDGYRRTAEPIRCTCPAFTAPERTP